MSEYKKLHDGKLVDVSSGEIITYEDFKSTMKLQKMQLQKIEEEVDEMHGVIPKYRTHQLGWNSRYSFVKYFHVSGVDMKKDMDIYERGLVDLLTDNLEWETNRVVIDDKNVTNGQFTDILGIGKSTLIRTFDKLELRRLIKRVGGSQGRQIYVNPEYAFVGKDMEKSTIELFIPNNSEVGGLD